MPRVPRINIENALYYVTSRGDNNEDIFKEGSDYAMYLELLKKAKDQYGFRLFAFCLVPTHAHLLIELSGDSTISQIMHALNSNYTKYFNSRTSRKGHLFQERYRMVLVEKEPNLLNITAYIHLNPKALNLTLDAESYPYSSCPLYIEEGRQGRKMAGIDMAAEIKEVKTRLGGRTYGEFLAGVPAGEMEELGKTLSKKLIVGSEKFEEEIKSKVDSVKEKAANKSENSAISKRLITIGILLVLALSSTTFSFYSRTVRMKEMAKSAIAKKDAEFKKEIAQERQFIRKDLDEKYRADMVSYEAMQKRLEIEKRKIKELEANAAKPKAYEAQKAVKR